MALPRMNSAGLIDLVPASLRQQWKDEGIYPDRPVYRLFADQVQRRPAAPAVLMPGRVVSYAQLDQAVRRLAGSFRRMGLVAGDVIAYPLPPGRGKLDIASLLRRSAARAFIVEPHEAQTDMCQLVEALRPTLLSLRFPIVDGPPRAGWQTLVSLLRVPALADAALVEVDADAPVRLLVSSGTESEPKLVAYSHNALVGGARPLPAAPASGRAGLPRAVSGPARLVLRFVGKLRRAVVAGGEHCRVAALRHGRCHRRHR